MHIDHSAATAADVVASYWQTYYDWRNQYGVTDTCMEELRAAILVELDSGALNTEQRFRLQAIAALIQQDGLYGDRAA